MSRTEGLSLDCPSSKESTPLRTPSNEQAQFTMITYAKIPWLKPATFEPLKDPLIGKAKLLTPGKKPKTGFPFLPEKKKK